MKVDLASYSGNAGAKLNLILLHAFFFLFNLSQENEETLQV